MTSFHDDLATVFAELRPVLEQVDPAQVESMLGAWEQAARIFPAGAGRSGLIVRALAMRLAQAGRIVHIVGDATTPSIGPGDLLLVASGSGRTPGMLTLAERARQVGARLGLITYSPGSPLAALADAVLVLPVPLDPARPGGVAGQQLLGTLFDQSLALTGDVLVRRLCRRLGVSPADMQQRHANLE